MKAAYLQEKQKIVVRDDRPLPSPSADQALMYISTEKEKLETFPRLKTLS